MTQSVENKILTKIKKARRGTLFFVESFLAAGNSRAINKALERLVKKSELSRVATGIYVRPQTDPVIGLVSPGIDAIATAIAKRDRARIVPTGIYALNKLGLSTQVPLNTVYLTDGAQRKIIITNRMVASKKIVPKTITFKKTSPKNVAAIGKISKLAIQALRSIGKDKVTGAQINKIRSLLKNEKPAALQHDYRLAPAWIREIFEPVLNRNI